jgi:hypothetical protein
MLHEIIKVPAEAGVSMNDFNRKVEQATEHLEKEAAELIKYLNDEVIPAVRQHSTKALRIASEKLAHLADYMDENKGK